MRDLQKWDDDRRVMGDRRGPDPTRPAAGHRGAKNASTDMGGELYCCYHLLTLMDTQEPLGRGDMEVDSLLSSPLLFRFSFCLCNASLTGVRCQSILYVRFNNVA